VVNSHLVCDPTIRQPGFDLPRQQWSLLNYFRTEQEHCGACRRKWRLTDTDLCPCGETQTMFHVEASCHKHFVGYSGNQHRRLLPAMCHNLRRPRLQHLPVAALTQAVKPDIGSESQFLPTPPAFEVPVRGNAVGILLWRLAWKKLDWRGYPMVKIFWYVYSFWHDPRTWQKHGRTDGHRQTPHDDIGRACIVSLMKLFNSPFAHHNLFSRMHMGVRNDPNLGSVFSDSFSSTKKLKICTVSIMFSQPCTYNS